MFCCSGDANKEVYELRSKHSQRVETITQGDMLGQRYPNHLQILKISRSDYRQLVELYKSGREMWQDQEFPPSPNSLGQVPGVNFHEWKRLSSIIKNPVLFDGRIEPQDVIQGSLGDCYFLSAVSALAQKQERIKSVFGEQSFNRNGIYRVTLRIGGLIQEIVVDDYVPVNKNGEPIFCQPNKNEFWVPILEKAWAKVNGSYANIIAGSPIELFKAATYAPAETFDTTPSKQQQQLLWKVILTNSRRDSPCCCGTSDSPHVRWTNINLVPAHAYTLIDAVQLQDFDGNLIRMLKLRNPWGNTEWQGEGCESDLKFWGRISKTKSACEFLRNSTINDDGIFFIKFRDYCKYFAQTHISYMEESGNYISESYTPVKKRGTYWSLNVAQENQYCIEVHQGSDRNREKQLSRATMVLAKNSGQSFEYVTGILSHYEEDITLRVKLTPGNYTIFTKLDLQESKSPSSVQKVSISVYSLPYVVLTAVDRTLYGNMLREAFLTQARLTKRKRLQNDTMWISWKLLFKEGGYAYIAFGVEKTASSKFHISFNESDFINGSFKLKKPFKGRGEGQQLQVGPGEERIVLARVANKNVQNLKFPPPIQWKVVPVQP